jgi:hypothetical protein
MAAIDELKELMKNINLKPYQAKRLADAAMAEKKARENFSQPTWEQMFVVLEENMLAMKECVGKRAAQLYIQICVEGWHDHIDDATSDELGKKLTRLLEIWPED